MKEHDNCWRCGHWFSYGPYHSSGGTYPKGRLGLCEGCWETLREVFGLILILVLSFLAIAGGLTKIACLAYPLFLLLFCAAVYGGIQIVRGLDNNGWFNFVDRIREKHLEPGERDK